MTCGRLGALSVYGAALNGATAVREVTENLPLSPTLAARSCSVWPQKNFVDPSVPQIWTDVGVVPEYDTEVTVGAHVALVEKKTWADT